MEAIDESVIDEAIHQGSTMSRRDLFGLIERSQNQQAGVDREVVVAYARELESKEEYAFDADRFLDVVDEKRTAETEWARIDHYYELPGDRLSQYPARWHDELGGSTDATAYVRFITEEVPTFVEELGRGGVGAGIPEDTLIKILATIGKVDRTTAQAAIENARETGDLTEDADQHPQAGVYLADEGVHK
jgi:hypothetical protein